MKKNIIIVLDPAHGADVPGKCSPDKKHREYKWSRERISHLIPILTNLGYEVYKTTSSENEPGLSKRKNFATQVRHGEKKLLLSLHNNAAGADGNWHTATGVEIYTTPGVTKSDICADIILQRFKNDFPELKMRYNKDSYLERDKEAKFTVLMGADYMGCLVEWLFQDNKNDVELLCDPTFNGKFESSIVEAIEEINDYFGK